MAVMYLTLTLHEAVDRLDERRSAFRPRSSYQKGANILAMFEQAIGPDKFRDGVRAYIAKHRYGSAASADFIAAIAEVAGRDVGPAFRSFLDQAGAPVVRSELDRRGRAGRALRPRRPRVNPDRASARARCWRL